MFRPANTLLAFALVTLLAAGCGDDGPANPGGGNKQYLAGGGRQAGDDAFSSGPGFSGPGRPDFELPSPDLCPLFYADEDCRGVPGGLVITDADDWQAWWTDAIACLEAAWVAPRGGDDLPDSAFNPYPAEAPPVDFATSTVFVVALEPDDEIGRNVWVQEVTDGEVHYVVSHFGDDCFGARELDALPASPTVAVVGPLVADPEQVTWRREDVTWDCSWEPDPNEPMLLYYTDAACDLGPEHAVITDGAAFDAWLATAAACDQERWNDQDGVPVPQDSTQTWPPAPMPGWLGLQVDFTTHAVIILRGDEQDRWGGGVWLSAISAAAGGTAIEYAVMDAGENCPAVEGGTTVRPTVAIRVPLPLDAPITWHRTTETIACDWNDGGPDWGGGTDSTTVRPPRR